MNDTAEKGRDCPWERELRRSEPAPGRTGVAEARSATETTAEVDKHMKAMTKCVGLDVHKDATVIAVADGARDGLARLYGEISSDLG